MYASPIIIMVHNTFYPPRTRLPSLIKTLTMEMLVRTPHYTLPLHIPLCLSGGVPRVQVCWLWAPLDGGWLILISSYLKLVSCLLAPPSHPLTPSLPHRVLLCLPHIYFREPSQYLSSRLTVSRAHTRSANITPHLPLSVGWSICSLSSRHLSSSAI